MGRFNQQVADLFGVEDLHTTQTLAVNSSDYSSSTDTAAKQYGMRWQRSLDRMIIMVEICSRPLMIWLQRSVIAVLN